MDEKYFSRYFLKLRRKLRVITETKKIKNSLSFSYSSHYNKNPHSLLSKLCDKYGSDKGEIQPLGNPYSWPSHTYADYYSELFDHCRMHIKSVFECGIGTNNPSLISSMGLDGKPGASLRVWNEYFPNAIIIGADIDKDVLFEEERIQTFYVNQMDSTIIFEMWKNIAIDDFDLIIDDGLHTFEAGVCFFENSIKKLSNNGLYIIEDVTVNNRKKFEKYFFDKKYQVNFVCLFRPEAPVADNYLIVIRKFIGVDSLDQK